MERSINELIETYKNKDGSGGFSYQKTYGSDKEVYLIDIHNLGDFWKEYCNMASTNESENNEVDNINKIKGLSLGESITKESPIIFNMNFIFSDCDTNEDIEIPDPLIFACVSSIQDVINSLLFVSEESAENLCVYLESPTWKDGPLSRKNIRFHFPFTRVDKDFQKNKIRPLVIKKLEELKALSYFKKCSPISSWDGIIKNFDKIVPLYGSVEKSSDKPLKYKFTFPGVEEEQIDTSTFADFLTENEEDYITRFETKYHSYAQKNYIDSDMLDDKLDNLFWLPLILSVDYHTSMTKILKLTADNIPVNNYDYEENDMISDKLPTNMLRALLPIISLDTYLPNFSWLMIGNAINNITDEGEDGLELFVKYSVESGHRTEKETREIYPTLTKGNYNIRTIGQFAKRDNPITYSEWHSNW